MNEETAKIDVGVTYQMSIDAFLDEKISMKHADDEKYTQALSILKKASGYRSPNKRIELAKLALDVCEDCIEAYVILGNNEESIYQKIETLKKGVDLATMNLGQHFFHQNLDDFFECEEALSFFQIKEAYALALFHAGYMKKANRQFIELYRLNPSDVFSARYYVISIALYFEELEICRDIFMKYKEEDTFITYANFLYHMKFMDYMMAKKYIPKMKEQNAYLYEILTYRNNQILTNINKEYTKGSLEEASYVYHILYKVIQSMEYIHIFLVRNE